MEITSLFGLPAHPLLVHAPIVLIPLAAVGGVLMCWRSWRARVGWITVALSAVALGFLQLSIGSGEQLQEHVRETALVRDHAQLADQLRPLAGLFFLAVLGVMLWEWWQARREPAHQESEPPPLEGPVDTRVSTRSPAARPRDTVLAGLLAATIVFGALSVIWLGRTGHSGAKATWLETQQRIDRGTDGGERNEGGG